MKELIKRTCAAAMQVGADLRRRPRVVVLCYHSIGVKLSAACFEEQIAWIAEHARVVELRDVPRLAAAPENRMPAVAVTFDDGYADNYDHALPILERYGIRATFFVTIGLVDRDPRVLETFRRQRGHRVLPLDWSQVTELRAAGHGVGAHTRTHPNLLRLPAVELDDELLRPRHVLESRLGEPVVTFAYPFGKPRRHFSQAIVDAVRSSGYELAVTTVCRGVRATDPALALPRLLIGADSPETLARKVLGGWDFLGGWQEHAPVALARVASPGDFQV